MARESVPGLMIRRLSVREESEWLRDLVKDIKNRKTVVLFVVVDGRIEGNCEVIQLKWAESHRGRFGIFLSKEIRGKGIGEPLFRRTIELAKKRLRGLEILELSVETHNRPALKLYRRLGFVRIGRMSHSVKDGKKYFDEYLMVLNV